MLNTLQTGRAQRPSRKCQKHKQTAGDVASPRVMSITGFPGAVIDGVSFVDCIFRGIRASEVVEASDSILFRNVKIEPAEKGRIMNQGRRGSEPRDMGQVCDLCNSQFQPPDRCCLSQVVLEFRGANRFIGENRRIKGPPSPLSCDRRIAGLTPITMYTPIPISSSS